MLPLILVGLARAATDAPPTEIVVFGDPFARWEQRWYVETEVHLAAPLRLLAEVNHEVDVVAYQARAVLDCHKSTALGEARFEVDCAIEDVSLRTVGVHRAASDDAVLAELDATLTGARLQLQVGADGGVPDVDLEGVPHDNQRESDRAEALRQVMSRVILPFHYEMPQPFTDGARWLELNSRLMTMPSPRGSSGASTLSHVMTRLPDGHYLVQTVGESTTAPLGGQEYAVEGEDGLITAGGVPVDLFRLQMSGVGVIEGDTGILSERVWAISGELTASSPSAEGRAGPTYSHTGRLRMLGPDEHPELGASYAAARGKQDADRPAWVPLTP